MHRFRNYVGFFCLLLPLYIHSQALSTLARSLDLSDEAKTADAGFMTVLYDTFLKFEGKDGRTAMPLDFADDFQFHFFLRRLVSAGKTPETAPRLYERLEAMRVRHLSRQNGEQRRTAEVETQPWCDQMITLNQSDGASFVNFKSSAIVSCSGGADYVFADLAFYRTNFTKTYWGFIGDVSAEEYGGGVFFEDAALNHDVVADENMNLTVDLTVIACNDTTGEEYVTFERDDSWLMPYALPNTSSARSTATEKAFLEVWEPRNIIQPSGEIDIHKRVCLDRGGYADNIDCDYATTIKDGESYSLYNGTVEPTGLVGIDENATSEWAADPNLYWEPTYPYQGENAYLPLRGFYDVGRGHTIASFNQALVRVFLQADGGNCVPIDPTKPGLIYKESFKNEVEGNCIGNQFCYFDALINLGPDCLNNFQILNIFISVKPKDTNGNRRVATKNINGVDYKNSCFPAGTLVTLAGGLTKTIEDIQIGDRVLSNSQGRFLKVTGLTKGGERKPLVYFKDDLGQELWTTEKHPIFTQNGILAADLVQEGDRVFTTTGVTQIQTVKREPYQGSVYNLDVESGDPKQSVTIYERTFFANGFLVGDNAMQSEIERLPEWKKSQALARLHKSWLSDFQHSQANRCE